MSSAATIRIFGTGDGSPLLSEFLATLPAPIVDRSLPVAIRALDAFLNRAPSLADLNAATMFDFSSTLIDGAISPETADRYLRALRRVATAAVGEGLMSDVDVPRLPLWRGCWKGAQTVPWSAGELSKLFAAARSLPGDVGGIPAGIWWRSLLLASLDTRLPVAPLLSLPGPAFDRGNGALTVGLFVYGLQPRTAAAIAELGTSDAEKLWPWACDAAAAAASGNPFYMVFEDFRALLKRAGLPHGQLNLFRRLRITADSDPEIIDAIDFSLPFELPAEPTTPPAPPKLHQKTQGLRKRRTPPAAASPNGKLPSGAKPRKPVTGPEVYRIAINSDRSLLRWFNAEYVPRRLAGCSPGTATVYRCMINRLSEFCCCDCTLDALSDDLAERFLGWYRGKRSPNYLKSMRGALLSLWAWAWKKRFVETQVRDVPPVRTARRIPECWSVGEIDRLLTVAGAAEGTVCGTIPAALFWPALISFIFDTGLRINAAMQARVADFDPEGGWIKVYAETQKQNADQCLPISEATVHLILATKPAGRELLFPWQFSDRKGSLNSRLRYLLKMAGLQYGRRDLWHKIRRTTATYVADAAGEEAARVHLGQSDLAVTRASYIDPRKLTKARVIDNMQRPAWKPTGLLAGPAEGQPS